MNRYIDAKIVIGLSYGDEGKGAMVDYLCRTNEVDMVVRFSGGHQAGHNVVGPHGKRHTFSNFGSGTFAGVPTFWSKHCTFHPYGCLNEYEALLGYYIHTKMPQLYVDPLAPVTTPYDIVYNRMTEALNKHGSCGVGFSATVERHETLKFHAMDMFHKNVMRNKMWKIDNWYRDKLKAHGNYNKRMLDHYQKECQSMLPEFDVAVKKLMENKVVQLKTETEMLKMVRGTIVFEGSQGIMLDQSHGFFPHVTRSNTTSRNAMEMLERWNAVEYCRDIQPSSRMDREVYTSEVIYVTRAYQTRHGEGPMTREGDYSLKLRKIKDESNKTNKWQGEFRRGTLDAESLKYALECDRVYHSGLNEVKRSLAVTCLDQINRKDITQHPDAPPIREDEFPISDGEGFKNGSGTIKNFNAKSLATEIGLSEPEHIYVSDAPDGIKEFKQIEEVTTA